jgi:hypothetical protein
LAGKKINFFSHQGGQEASEFALLILGLSSWEQRGLAQQRTALAYLNLGNPKYGRKKKLVITQEEACDLVLFGVFPGGKT